MDSSARYRSVDCLTMIEQRMPALTGASRQVGEAILRNPWATLGMTIYEVADASGVSLPSVTRFARAIGYGGFRELIQGLAQSLGRIEGKDLESLTFDGDAGSMAKIADEIVRRQIDALQTTIRTLDYEAVSSATSAIAAAELVSVIGHGSAHVPASGLALKLNFAGVPAFSATPDLFSNQVMSIRAGHVVIGVSHQGRTRDTIEMVKLAGDFGATTIGISTVPHSPLASVADISLSVLTPEVARAGTFVIAFDALMVLADILAASVAQAKWDGMPPNRRAVDEWIETNLRIAPAALLRP